MEWIYDLFEFSKKYPMDFTQMGFWVFFFIVYTGFAFVYKRLFVLSQLFFLLQDQWTVRHALAIQHYNGFLLWPPDRQK